MRVLWVAMGNSFQNLSHTTGDYNGVGWIGALLRCLVSSRTASLEIGVTFLCDTKLDSFQNSGVFFFPIQSKKRTGLSKLYYYWWGYKHNDYCHYVPQLQAVIAAFKPDIIHLWGIENQLSCVCYASNIPVVAHLQGILNSYYEHYYPYKSNAFDVLAKNITPKEWIFKNGINCGHKIMRHNAAWERQCFGKIQYYMGRTEWDRSLAALMSPKACYYHVNEALRPEFYDSPAWNKTQPNHITIISTISETIYKGLDNILKTAYQLSTLGTFHFEWKVIGVRQGCNYVRYMEKTTGLKSQNLNVRFLGVMNAKEIANEMLKSDIYVHPSYIDNSPNSLCEAQYLGVPIIANNVGGISSLVHNGETGWLVGANDPLEMASRIVYAVHNREETCKIARQGRDVALSRHNREKILSDLVEAYRDVRARTATN